MNTVSLNNLWNYLQGLSLTANNQRWLANNLMQAANATDGNKKQKKLEFPKIPEHYKPSNETMEMACGPFPEGFDVEKELQNMWEERAQ